MVSRLIGTQGKGNPMATPQDMPDNPQPTKDRVGAPDVAPPERLPTTEEELHAAHVDQPPARLDGPVLLTDYDPAWPVLYAREAERVRAALGERVLFLEHVGSTSVPGLAAKPKIDMLLGVADSADEAAYVPALETAGYVLHIREPDWHEHRLFKGPDTDINLHVFSAGHPEIARMLLFRDWLRDNETDRRFYEQIKRELAARTWTYTQHYADAKTAVVEQIIARATAANAAPGDKL
jgi:GrpB-like predicted nucleotidyltransferase (UPF0157 family)